MIIPEEKLPLDDADHSGNADQPSQQDIHSTGIDDVEAISPEAESAHDADQLEQAAEAAEASFTLDYEDGFAPDPNKANEGKPNDYNKKQ